MSCAACSSVTTINALGLPTFNEVTFSGKTRPLRSKAVFVSSASSFSMLSTEASPSITHTPLSFSVAVILTGVVNSTVVSAVLSEPSATITVKVYFVSEVRLFSSISASAFTATLSFTAIVSSPFFTV